MNVLKLLLLVFSYFLLSACIASQPPTIPVNYGSVEPGSMVTRGGTPLTLLGHPVEVGQPLPSVVLYNNNLGSVDLSQKKGQVVVVSVVPSIDTGVCERQTHLLGEKEGLFPGISRVTVSRDLPYAQKRFREAVDFTGVEFLSDYQKGEFGLKTGLFVDKIGLLARAVMVLDKDGIVRYLQVVPELGNLPDMERAFAFAEQLAQEG